MASNVLFRFFVLQVKWTSHVMVKTPCTCRSPTPVTCTVSQRLGVFQTVTTTKTICKSSLGQLLATEFDIDVKPCFSFSTCARLQLTPSAACLKRCVVSNKTHEKTHLCVDRACACLSVFVPVNTPPRRLQTTKRSACANVRHALYIPNSKLHQGTLVTLLLRM